MIPEDYARTINAVKEKHHHFDLTSEQAEKMHQFEQEKDLYSREYYFSVWEEYDYVYDNYQKILNDEQFEKFNESHQNAIKRHEEFLIQTDKDQTKWINYHKDLLHFYQNEYIPKLFKEVYLHESVALESANESKVALLKHEYESFLESQKVGYLSEHYRHNKLFRPNELKATMLRHQLNYVVPRYSFFKIKMDEPTKAAAQFLFKTLHYIPNRYEEFFKRANEKLSLIAEELRKKHLEEITRWHTTIPQNEQERNEDHIMQVVLLDTKRILPLLNLPFKT